MNNSKISITDDCDFNLALGKVINYSKDWKGRKVEKTRKIFSIIYQKIMLTNTFYNPFSCLTLFHLNHYVFNFNVYKNTKKNDFVPFNI